MTPQANEALLLYNRATKYLERGKKDKAWQFYKKSVKLHGSKEAYLNMGTIEQGNFNLKEAERYYKLSIAEDPNYTLALNNLGLIEWYLGDDEAAVKYLNRAVDIDHTYSEAYWNRSLAVLRQWCEGNISGEAAKLGWADYEHRFIKKTQPTKLKMDVTGLKYWKGENDGRIIVVAEQGQGDIIMFGRYVIALAQEGYDISLQCSPEIADLFPTVNTVAYPKAQAYDYFVPTCSLCGATGWTTTDPYIITTDETIKGEVGVCWHGNPDHANDHWRSVRESDMAFISNGVSLQAGETSKIFRNEDLSSWSRTQKVISRCELVITVDTSIAHLAGAMGKETWILQPKFGRDFRWGTSRKDSMWYSNVRNFDNLEELRLAYKERYDS